VIYVQMVFSLGTFKAKRCSQFHSGSRSCKRKYQRTVTRSCFTCTHWLLFYFILICGLYRSLRIYNYFSSNPNRPDS
jgi:hypothetical protein